MDVQVLNCLSGRKAVIYSNIVGGRCVLEFERRLCSVQKPRDAGQFVLSYREERFHMASRND